MKRFLRHTMFCLVTATLAALVLGVRPAAPDVLQSVGLSCSDGTALDLALSMTEVIDLSGAVLAVNSLPAGTPPLTCSLSQDPSGSGNPHYDYAVGGGQVQKGLCTINFALSAHVGDTDATSPPTSGGTFNLTEQQSCLMPSCAPTCCICTGGHLVAKPDCLHVEGNVAQLNATVTHSDGSFSSLFPVGSEIYVEAEDNPDMIGWNGETGVPTVPCDACPATMQLLHGNVSVHDADCPGCAGTPCTPPPPTTTTTTTTTTSTAPTGPICHFRCAINTITGCTRFVDSTECTEFCGAECASRCNAVLSSCATATVACNNSSTGCD